MQITLLTHQRERQKSTGTGKLVKQALKEKCNIIEWHRKHPDSSLTSLDHSKTALVYPIPETATWPIKSLPEDIIPHIEHFIILDGTWQEAQKIYNRSPYLHSLFHYALSTQKKSAYKLRRNQRATGLCTAEVAMEILAVKGEDCFLKDLQRTFKIFNTLSETFAQNHEQ